MKYWFAALGLFFLTVSCSTHDDPIEERAQRARNAKGDIIIGAVAPWAVYPGMWEGIEIAVSELNKAGGVLDRKIQIIKKDDEGSVTKGQKIAQNFADNLDMVAVIGHYNSHVSIPCSITYEYNGLLMLTPYSNNPELTSQGLKRVFRNSINDQILGQELARFSRRQGYNNVLIYHAKNSAGNSLANAFERHSTELGINIKDRLSYDSIDDAQNFQKDLIHCSAMYDFDAIFLAGDLPQAAIFVREVRKLGITVPIIGTESLDFQEFLKIAGSAAEGTFVGTVFYPTDPREGVQAFVTNYHEKHGSLPGNAAARGYDSIMVLAHAMEKSGTTIPDSVGQTLRAMDHWDGIIHKTSFDQQGDIVDGRISLDIVRNGQFEFFEDTVTDR